MYIIIMQIYFKYLQNNQIFKKFLVGGINDYH